MLISDVKEIPQHLGFAYKISAQKYANINIEMIEFLFENTTVC